MDLPVPGARLSVDDNEIGYGDRREEPLRNVAQALTAKHGKGTVRRLFERLKILRRSKIRGKLVSLKDSDDLGRSA